MKNFDITEIQSFTARQLADASGQSRQNVQQLLEKIPPSGQRRIKGSLARAWELSALPASLQAQLQAVAQQRGYDDAVSLLSGPAPIWQPRAPIEHAAPEAMDKAVKLRSVLQPFLAAKDTDTRSQAQFESDGVAAYQKVFGHPITGRWFRQLFQRAAQRDNLAENWMRLEIYLDDAAAAQPKPRAAAVNKLPACLATIIQSLADPAQPTAEDAKFIFDAAFRYLEQNSTLASKRALITALHAALPALAKSRSALRRTFSNKLALWRRAGGDINSLQDKRALHSGNFRKPDFSADQTKIRDQAILHDGNVSLAHRKLRQAGQLSQNFVNHYHFDPRRNKSYVPSAVRHAITPQAKMCGPLHHGPWRAKMQGPYIPRDWSAVHPGDWFSGDDFTFNHVWADYDETGKLHLHRGECLVIIDLRTGCVLDFILIAGHYNSRHIRKLILKIHDRYGLPHTGFYFERGVWKARIIRDLASRENLPWRETESGLAQFHLTVKHATTPRAKTIEGLGRIWQERQRNEPGFVGFDERRDEREVIQDYLARVRRGTADPSKLLSMGQWSERLNQHFRAYNDDPQNGKMLRGQSPAEAWQAGLQRQPLRQLPQDARYLLATHTRRLTIRQQGIVLTIGGNKMLFCNEQTGRLIGRDVLVYYNFDCPELLTVSDLNRQNYFTVKAICLPAMSATKEQFAHVHADIAGHRQAAREIYGNIPRQAAATITRDNAISEPEKQLGRFVNNTTEQFKHEQTAARRALRQLQIESAAAGLQLPGNIRQPDRVLRAIRDEAAIRAQIEAEENSTQDIL